MLQACRGGVLVGGDRGLDQMRRAATNGRGVARPQTEGVARPRTSRSAVIEKK